MINVKKGVAHSLQQTDIRGTAITGVKAGMLARVGTTGAIALGGDSTTGLRGFAINNSTDGDVIESNKIALYTLDGHSVLETDQTDSTDGALTATTYPVGTALYASFVQPGTVTKYAYTNAGVTAGVASSGGGATSNGPAIGWVEGTRYLQNNQLWAASATSQNYTSATEGAALTAGGAGQPVYTATTGTASFKPQVNIPVLGIKLAATA